MSATTKEGKQKEVNELHEKFKSAKIGILTNYSGLSVSDITDLRNRLRSVEAELRVVKNTLAVRAAEGTSLDHAKSAFEGPVAVALGYADPVSPAKILTEFSNQNDHFQIKLGVIEGRLVDPDHIKFIASLPDKDTLLASLISQIQAPLAGICFVLEGIIHQFIGTLEGIKEKKTHTGA